MGAYSLPIFHCMYIGTAVDLINAKEYINYGTCMWACIRTFDNIYVCAFFCFMGGGMYNCVIIKGGATKF